MKIIHSRVTRATLHRAASAFTLAALLSALFVQPAFAAAKPGGNPPPEPEAVVGPVAINTSNTPGDDDSTPSLYKITHAGSYYLTGNLTGVSGMSGIEVVADDVTIDLRGFTLQGVAGSFYGIYGNGTAKQLTVRNGTVRGWISGISSEYRGNHFADVNLIGNSAYGLQTGAISIITDCSAVENGGTGVVAFSGSVLTRVRARANATGILCGGKGVKLNECSAIENTGAGFQLAPLSVLVGCSAILNGGAGFDGEMSTTYEGCTADDNGGAGFFVGESSTMKNCVSHYNDADGFKVVDGTVLIGCSASYNALDGIEANGTVRIENCTASKNFRSGFALNTQCQIRGSLAEGNTVYGIHAEGNCQVVSNHLVNNGLTASGAGIYAVGSGNHIESNTCNSNRLGIWVIASDNVVIRNTARSNQSNFNLGAGVEYGQVITNPGAAFVSSNSWANISY
jgi:parallel beta-helix repeat protein